MTSITRSGWTYLGFLIHAGHCVLMSRVSRCPVQTERSSGRGANVCLAVATEYDRQVQPLWC